MHLKGISYPQLNQKKMQKTKKLLSYLGNNCDEDGDPLAHGGGEALEELAADLAASGR